MIDAKQVLAEADKFKDKVDGKPNVIHSVSNCTYHEVLTPVEEYEKMNLSEQIKFDNDQKIQLAKKLFADNYAEIVIDLNVIKNSLPNNTSKDTLHFINALINKLTLKTL
jgi:hypothetical protein